MTETRYYRSPDATVYRVTVRPDDDAMSPRDADNVTIMQTFPSRFRRSDISSPDDGYVKASELIDVPSEWVDDGRVDMRRFGRYVNLFGADLGIIGMAGLDIHQDWQPTLTLRLFDTDAAACEEYDGIIAITRASWDKCIGADIEPTAERVTEYMAQDVDAYNRWATGESMSFTVEQAVAWLRADDQDVTRITWEFVDSCGSIDQGTDDDYALSMALECLPDGCEQIDEPAFA